jgi:hypothetical protein
VSPAPNRAELLESEKGLMRPAGIAALIGVLLFVASAFIQSSVGGESLDTDAELLTQYGEDGGTLLLGRIVFGLSFLFFTLPLYTLFRAVQARTDRVRNYYVAFCFIGPLLLAVQGPLLASGYKDAGEKYLEQEPALAAEAKTEPEAKPESEQEGTTTAADDAATTTTSDEDEDEEDTPQENLAEDLIDESGTVSFAQPLLLPALLGMVTIMVFLNIWALRTGLLTRFWGSLGVALGAAMIIILPIALLGSVIWFLALGMLLLGFGRRARPPAWEAGVAMPWPPRGAPPPDDPGGPVEGSGRDISGEGPEDPPEDPPPGPGENGSGGSGGPELPPGPTYPPQKRKRRRD